MTEPARRQEPEEEKQLRLFGGGARKVPIERNIRAAQKNYKASFERFHARVPKVYELFCYYADKVISFGHKRCSAWLIINRIRWFHKFNPEKFEHGFKIANGHIAYYARLWLADHPSHPDFLETRELKAP